MGEITYDLKDPAFCFTIIKVPDDYCSLTSRITNWLSEVEQCKVSALFLNLGLVILIEFVSIVCLAFACGSLTNQTMVPIIFFIHDTNFYNLSTNI